ncbi:cell wall elongation regulator TseB-like domain-containing protein [Furfurilactobacillus curtus]|uniref:Cell wall elongation regulator TseB-like domain-containing protein n=1 Tax=Furfurilactobacillus curtus TaxID=1746200 RepID=A0ABQ5JM28_9LACO
MQRRRRQRKNWGQITLWSVLAVILIVGSVMIVFHEALRPANTAAKQTVQIARKAGVNDAKGFLTFNRQQTYYAVNGHNRKGKSVYVIVAKKNGHVTIVHVKAGQTKTAILQRVWSKQQPKKVLNVGLGIRNGQPVWEVTYLNQKGNLCYDLIRYRDSKTIQSIQNL